MRILRNISLDNRFTRIVRCSIITGAQSNYISARLCDRTGRCLACHYDDQRIMSMTPTVSTFFLLHPEYLSCLSCTKYPRQAFTMGCRISRPVHSDQDRLVNRSERLPRPIETKEDHVQAQIEKHGLHLIPLRHANSATAADEARAEAYDAARGQS